MIRHQIHHSLNVEEYKEDVSSSVPWHVIKSCCVIVDLMPLKCPDDLFVDGWKWPLLKTYVVSGSSKSGPFRKGNIDSYYWIVKRIYTCIRIHIHNVSAEG